ncbi:scm-like with four MBT domains protein 2 isoform X1 [Nomia melanderi]|uniref:scm-like with four MBT domains protein 2 isoform X1 n=2 Tax=Nomia melanderi TaxID=2448451 RepID=UPI0013044C87|nr:scm-like with four MBT domains protein 1 isoform X1 [Nomia melanderi]XP_031833954.1 scm-like with four MBT domains protein 1 isoform X1 [Nomia melanderi]XP_031833955.1 scm-like with four MBT domains protein 1 isoform X1 [Nomia melanderi]XP_031833956.1 scm-like with four MBT domains protein 1 isoform X1 [Nomia melanderi]XP_031833958.1 scm-like with four MBT domains protein 1 isoform X1 [Nomia melanderi]XP_031833959.1 scm-like with four MBT domains protein 1 isoform X1 [Nomia melanderi]XP_03
MEPCEGCTQEKVQEGEYGFFWQDYLDATQSVEVPQIMFPHVELTLQSGIEIGMSLEVPHPKNANEGDHKFWVASIVMACGPLLRLRYFGGDDRSLEFWFNLTKEAAHELGWCMKNNKKLEPPDIVLQRSPDCVEKLTEFLATARTVPPEMLSGDGLSMTERIKQGMKVEVSDTLHPYKLWVATIIENVGGRLLLRYDTPGSSRKDFWMFCTSEHLHPYGFASKSDSTWFLEPPSSIVEMHTYEEWKDLLETTPKDNGLLEELFHNSVEHQKHNFKVGMKLEALSPSDHMKICPATVIKVLDDTYFLVHIDMYDDSVKAVDIETFVYNSTEKNTWLCTAEHPYIFPVGWANKHNIKISAPQGWTSKEAEFDWDLYLKETRATAAEETLFPERQSAADAGFENGMRLEAVDPGNENIICAAHITNIVDNLLWLKLDNYDNSLPEHIVDMHSLQIFPVGWCESNHYPLKPPKDYVEVCKPLQTPPKEDKKNKVLDIPISEPRSSLWCPKIYFNYRCFTGPMISKGKLATLPKAVGPGPVILVMREVLSMIVSVGYRSARILKVLQCDSKPDPGYHLEVLKAKHKNNTYRASVAVVTSGDMVSDFCRNICKKLMVCPNLFGPLYVPENECPDRCHKTSKAKFTASVGTGRRGKPKGYTSIMVQKPKPWGGRRKRRRGRWANREKEAHDDFDHEDEMPFMSLDLAKHVSGIEGHLDDSERPQLSEIDIMIQKGLEKADKSDDFKTEPPSSNASEDSGSSFNDRKTKDGGSPNNLSNKQHSSKCSQSSTVTRASKRERDWDTSIESDCSEADAEYVRMQKKQRRPKTRKLDSNPLFWSVDDVFRYLRKTNDCKDIAYRVKQEEIDGLAFLLLNLPSLTQHMKLRTSLAMKLCRHVEQVKVTFFLRHINEVEPEQYQIV